MKIIGIRCSKNALDWAVVEGSDTASATFTEREKATAPTNLSRAEELLWARKEVLELVARHKPDAVALAPVEPGAKTVSAARAEMDGVAQEASASTATPCHRMLAATIRGAFKARNGQELTQALDLAPALEEIPMSRRSSAVAALAVLAKQ